MRLVKRLLLLPEALAVFAFPAESGFSRFRAAPPARRRSRRASFLERTPSRLPAAATVEFSSAPVGRQRIPRADWLDRPHPECRWQPRHMSLEPQEVAIH